MRKFIASVVALACLAVPADVCAAGPAEVGTSARLDDFRTCGLTSYYTICCLFNVNQSWHDAEAALGPPREDGSHSFADLEAAGKKVGLASRGFHLTSRQDAMRLPTPAIVQSKFAYGKPEPHLLVLLRATDEGVELLDPPFPAFRLTWDEFEKVWTGNVLAFRPADATAELDDYSDRLAPSWFGRSALALAAAAMIGILYLAQWPLIRIARGTTLLCRQRPVLAATVVAGVVTACAGAVFFWTPHQSAPPTLETGDVVVNLGILPTGLQQATFTIKNSGDAPLTVEQVQSTCTCASVRPPTSVPPRGEAEVGVDLNVKAGPGNATLRFLTNDPVGPKMVRLAWQGEARPILSPAVIAPTSADTGSAIQKQVSIIYPVGAGVTPSFRRLRCDSNLVRVRSVGLVSSSEMTESGAELRGALNLEVTIDAPGRAMTLETDAHLFVEYGGQELDFPLRIYIVYRSQIAPAADGVLFSARRAENLVGQNRQVAIRGASDPGELQLIGCPAWLNPSFVRLPAGGVALELKCVSPPPSSGGGIELSIVPRAGAGTPTPLLVETFTDVGGSVNREGQQP